MQITFGLVKDADAAVKLDTARAAYRHAPHIDATKLRNNRTENDVRAGRP